MTETDLTHQLTLISLEQTQLSHAVTTLSASLGEADAITAQLDAAAALLRESRDKLDAGPLTFALQRDLVEKLIRRIIVKSTRDEATGKLHARLAISVVFDPDEPDPTDPTPGDDGDGDDVGIFSNTPVRGRSR